MQTRFLLLLTFALAARAAAAVIDVNLAYKDLRLKDGTVLAEATVKSYNSTAHTVLLLANKELSSVPTSTLPEDVVAKLKGLLPEQTVEEQAYIPGVALRIGERSGFVVRLPDNERDAFLAGGNGVARHA